MLEVNQRVIMLSGANRGIGAAVAERLFQAGYRLSLGVRRLNDVKVAELTAGWPMERFLLHHFEARQRASYKAWVEGTAARFGAIDGLINNAGISIWHEIEDDDEAALDAMWAVNVKAPLALTRLAMPYLRRSGVGRVVNVASLSGKRVKNGNVGYAMSKFAVVALSHATRQAGWQDGVRCTVVCPGFVQTDMTRYVEKFPREAMSDPGDVAELVATALALPNNASVAELLVNCQLESQL